MPLRFVVKWGSRLVPKILDHHSFRADAWMHWRFQAWSQILPDVEFQHNANAPMFQGTAALPASILFTELHHELLKAAVKSLLHDPQSLCYQQDCISGQHLKFLQMKPTLSSWPHCRVHAKKTSTNPAGWLHPFLSAWQVPHLLWLRRVWIQDLTVDGASNYLRAKTRKLGWKGNQILLSFLA